MNAIERTALHCRLLHVACTAAVTGLLMMPAVRAAGETNAHSTSAHAAMAASDSGAATDHSAHDHSGHAGMVASGIRRTEAMYNLPEMKLVREDGAVVTFPKELDDGRTVILGFIYTTCTTICPMTSHVFSELQGKLDSDRDKVHIVSISIDPEYDTPARLREYAKRYGAQTQWQHYTGSFQASITYQKAFDAYRGDKMNHFPVTFLRVAPGKPWVRIEGFATPDQILAEVRALRK